MEVRCVYGWEGSRVTYLLELSCVDHLTSCNFLLTLCIPKHEVSHVCIFIQVWPASNVLAAGE